MTHENSASARSTSARGPRGFRYRLHGVLFVLFAGLVAPACIASSGDVDGESVEDDYDAIAANETIARAEEWVHAKLHYCQAPNHHHDYDAACSSTCDRQGNAAWDPYRSDCSGLVSWAWELPHPGRVTGEFAPFENDVSHVIAATSLAPGDAVNNSEHIMLFKAWVHHGTEATFIEEPGCSSSTPYAHEFTSAVSISGQTIHVVHNGMTFTSIRYDGIGSGGSSSGAPSCQVHGVDGVCIETTACHGKPDRHATPGYCPGPANEECCTPDSGSPPPPPPPPASAPSCEVDGIHGSCIGTSSCHAKGGHHSTPGYCPGPASEECCTPDASLPSGPKCEVEGIEGVCIDKTTCFGAAGHVATPGFCPGPASEECCTKPKTCNVHGKSGMCIETSVCSSLHRHATAGYCPGPANEECCTE